MSNQLTDEFILANGCNPSAIYMLLGVKATEADLLELIEAVED